MNAQQTTPLRDFGHIILEVFGHRSFAGRGYEEPIAGGVMLRIDVFDPQGQVSTTQYYGANSIYSLTPCSEEAAKMYATRRADSPAAILGIPRLPAPTVPNDAEREYEPEIEVEDEENEFNEFDTFIGDDPAIFAGDSNEYLHDDHL